MDEILANSPEVSNEPQGGKAPTSGSSKKKRKRNSKNHQTKDDSKPNDSIQTNDMKGMLKAMDGSQVNILHEAVSSKKGATALDSNVVHEEKNHKIPVDTNEFDQQGSPKEGVLGSTGTKKKFRKKKEANKKILCGDDINEQVINRVITDDVHGQGENTGSNPYRNRPTDRSVVVNNYAGNVIKQEQISIESGATVSSLSVRVKKVADDSVKDQEYSDLCDMTNEKDVVNMNNTGNMGSDGEHLVCGDKKVYNVEMVALKNVDRSNVSPVLDEISTSPTKTADQQAMSTPDTVEKKPKKKKKKNKKTHGDLNSTDCVDVNCVAVESLAERLDGVKLTSSIMKASAVTEQISSSINVTTTTTTTADSKDDGNAMVDNCDTVKTPSVTIGKKKKNKRNRKNSDITGESSLLATATTAINSSATDTVLEGSTRIDVSRGTDEGTETGGTGPLDDVPNKVDNCDIPEVPSATIDNEDQRKQNKETSGVNLERSVDGCGDTSGGHGGALGAVVERGSLVDVARETAGSNETDGTALASNPHVSDICGTIYMPATITDSKKKRKRKKKKGSACPEESPHECSGKSPGVFEERSARIEAEAAIEADFYGEPRTAKEIDPVQDTVVEVKANFIEYGSVKEGLTDKGSLSAEGQNIVEEHNLEEQPSTNKNYDDACLPVKDEVGRPHIDKGNTSDRAKDEKCLSVHIMKLKLQCETSSDPAPIGQGGDEVTAAEGGKKPSTTTPDQQSSSSESDDEECGEASAAESESRNVASAETETESGDNAPVNVANASVNAAKTRSAKSAGTTGIHQCVQVTWRRCKGKISWRNAVCLPSKSLKKKIVREASAATWVPPEQVISQLAQHGIVFIEKDNRNKSNAKYFCCCCNHNLYSLSQFAQHTGLQSHINGILNIRDKALWLLPSPSQHHTSSLTCFIDSLYRSVGLKEERRSKHEPMVCEVRDFIVAGLRQKMPDIECSVGVQGSWHHGCGLTSERVDLSLAISSDKVDESCQEHIFTAFSIISAEPSKFKNIDLFDDLELMRLTWTHTLSGLGFSLTPYSRTHSRLSRLFAEYSLLDPRLAPLTAALKRLVQICGVDRVDRGYISPASYMVCVIHFLQQVRPPVLPVLHEMTSTSKACDDSPEYMPGGEACSLWTSSNDSDVGALWLQLLQFLLRTAFDDSVDYVVTIRQLARIDSDDRVWSHRKLAIEDPFHPERNMARTVSCLTAVRYLLDCLRAAFLYFSVPGGARHAPLCQESTVLSSPGARGEERFLLAPLSEEDVSSVWRDGDERIAASSMHVLDANVLGFGKEAPQYCGCCFGMNHSESNCPTMALKTPEPLPDLTDEHIELLTQLCMLVFKESNPSEYCCAIRDRLVSDLELWVRRTFPTARLQLFGSSLNGFGSNTADLDICMTFDDVADSKDLDVCSIVKKLAGCLSAMPHISSILPITTAKVPIVKFSHRALRVDGDISVYNTLALHNTQLLKTYAAVDNRVRVLGHFVKFLAKQCQIGDRSTGGLSSYGFILLLIFFLQRTEPPVLPVLQALAPEPPVLVQGRHVQFFMFSKRSQLAKVWPQLGANREPVGRLCVNLLRFYTEHFDFAKHVVCIRQSDTLTKVNKGWQAAAMAIEDPFLHEHNLAGGISKKMSVYIRRCFLQWRKHYGNTPPFQLPLNPTTAQFLLSADRLRGPDPPNMTTFRCWLCSSRLHGSKQCPKRNRSLENSAQTGGASTSTSRDVQSRVQMPAGMLLNRPSGAPKPRNNQLSGFVARSAQRHANASLINTVPFYNSSWRSGRQSQPQRYPGSPSVRPPPPGASYQDPPALIRLNPQDVVRQNQPYMPHQQRSGGYLQNNPGNMNPLGISHQNPPVMPRRNPPGISQQNTTVMPRLNPPEISHHNPPVMPRQNPPGVSHQNPPGVLLNAPSNRPGVPFPPPIIQRQSIGTNSARRDQR